METRSTEESSMISAEEISMEEIRSFWDLHIRCLVEDGIVSDE